MANQYVYWIHTTLMDDPTAQGYVGVTNNVKRRITNHFSKLRNNKHDNQHFQRAYHLDDDLVVDIIFEGTEEECYLMEQQLRPAKAIGWNINEGGTKPPKQMGNQHAKGNRGTPKQITSPDGLIFESRKAAAEYYDVDISTIYNWLNDPTKPWVKRGSVKQSSKYDITQHNQEMKRPIVTPDGVFESIKAAADHYNVVHGTINYWRKTKPDLFYLISLE